ncbi:uncharacterized protein N7529_000436 [Penicillium soppii]|uniref:uncharacterized protein n=1 Tax=Penicillium soppii TaxID=69789 RepID=UPI002548544C|nr:uncharacterized protein N7529_000436 [Penicillium soppii]KAJ5881764.1 hypothetical protein N7529_000436 [Penicillium soppii]
MDWNRSKTNVGDQDLTKRTLQEGFSSHALESRFHVESRRMQDYQIITMSNSADYQFTKGDNKA